MAPRILTYPTHKWLLPASNPQQAPKLVSPEQRVILPTEQRVDVSNPSNNPTTIVQTTDSPTVIMAPYTTTKCSLKATPLIHQRHRRNNISNMNNGLVITATPNATPAPCHWLQMIMVMQTVPQLPECSPRLCFSPFQVVYKVTISSVKKQSIFLLNLYGLLLQIYLPQQNSNPNQPPHAYILNRWPFQWYIQWLVKQFVIIKSWCTTWQRLKLVGKRHLGRILGVWDRSTAKLNKRGLTWSLSLLMKKSNASPTTRQ